MSKKKEEKVEEEIKVEVLDAEGNVESLEAAREEKADDESSDDSEAKEEKKEEIDYKSRYFYLAAEMENMKKRNARDRDSYLKYGNEKILKNLLDVVDNLDRTISACANEEDEKVKNLILGVQMVQTQFVEVLKGNGLEEVKALGEIFDPKFHEAMAQQPAEGKKDQEIINEFQKGYILNGRLLRAAKVVIASN